MNAYERKKLNRLEKAERNLWKIRCELSDVYGSDSACSLIEQAMKHIEAIRHREEEIFSDKDIEDLSN